MARVLVLGGGFGGLAAAHKLIGAKTPDLEVILFDQEEVFTVGFRKTWTLLGIDPEPGNGRRSNLEKKGIRRVHGRITSIEPQRKVVEANGEQFEGDFLVIALGVELAPELIGGLKEHALSVYDRRSLPRAAQALRQFQGGKIVVGIFGNPYQCPPAPYEIALLVNEQLRNRQVNAELTVFTPLPMSLPILGSAGCSVIEDRLADAGIKFLASHTAVNVEANKVVFSNGTHLDFDLLLGIAPHRAPEVVRSCGLTEGGDWVPVDTQTLETRYPGVFAIGDVNLVKMANGKPLPKAGVFAEGQGKVVAQRILETLAGNQPAAIFEGIGGCFLEIDSQNAAKIEGHFLAIPEPQVLLTDASPKLLEEKRQFEKDRLTGWLK
ncbi:MAG: hypothetical protein A2Z16_05145 [Chloroflexi bacterium RBG_16_54_18]|nr:MAG: hypothetical protein A2Z16_05145 [Chloroflexi bacterium RBG_16_54_18]